MSGARGDAVVLRRTRGRPRASLMVPLASALILVLGWSALWGVARWQADVAIDGFIVAEAAHGRRWSCPDRALTGFPLRIALECRGATFSGLVDGAPARGHLAGLRAETWLYEPSSLFIALDGPMALTSPDGRSDFTLDWSGFRATLRGLVGGLKRLEVVLDGATLARRGSQTARADHLELHAGPVPGRPAEDAADALDVALVRAAVPALDALTGETAALDGSFSGIVTRAYGDLPDLGPATVERWRRAGGQLDVAQLRLGKGALKATASGRLGLDPEHRPTGRLDASLAGFAPLAKRYGVPLGAVEVGGLLSTLLGGKAAPPPAAGADAVDLPITVADGAISIGPVLTAVRLKPLY